VVLPAVIAAEGAAFAVLAGLDGSAAWQAARVLLVAAVTAWAVWFTRRPGHVGRGAAALALGIAGTAAGTGAASAHLAKAGLDAAAAAASFVLVTGVVLLFWGAATLVRAIRGWWRLLAVPAALMLLWFVLLPLTVAVNATNRPPGPLGSSTPARYGLGYQDVAFRTADGVRLSACGTSRRATAPPCCCCPAPVPPAPRCSARPPCWPGTATARCWLTPAGMAAPAGTRWTSAGGVTGTSPPPFRS
jgi:hypothetical protein